MLLSVLLQAAASGMSPFATLGVALGAGIGIGKIGGQAMEAIGRQPEASNDIRSNMILSAALVEGVAFFALIVCILGYFLK